MYDVLVIGGGVIGCAIAREFLTPMLLPDRYEGHE